MKKSKKNALRQGLPLPIVPLGSAQSRWTALLLGLMLFMAPAMGVPSEEMLQDTLKSMVVSGFTLGITLVYLCQGKNRNQVLIWHHLAWLPVGLATYAIGSMAWSHTYLGGVEAVRWIIFSLIFALGSNTSIDDIKIRIPWFIHWGLLISSAWTAFQFWFDFNIFPQGPNPASTFVNRNFFGEYAICAIPYSLYILFQTTQKWKACLITATLGFNIVALMMTGTRSAIIAGFILLLLLPVFLLRFWQQIKIRKISKRFLFELAILLIGIIAGLGSIPTENPKLISEFGAISAIDRSVSRAASMAVTTEYSTGSFSIRSTMWMATARMIQANPWTGVGAGAWEVKIPLYQTAGTQLETDFYAHNEPLQLLAEYGLVGWFFLLLLIAYLIRSTVNTWTASSETSNDRTVIRAVALSSLLMLLIVSTAGFPWRMATTGALFAMSLSILATTDATNDRQRRWTSAIPFNLDMHRIAIVLTIGCILLAAYISQRAAASERTLVRGIKLALTISKSGDPTNRYWDPAKAEILSLMHKGIALNSHYRKLTPMAADELASWGDWRNALWIWESISESRPNVVAILANIARAHMEIGDMEQAENYLAKAQKIQPTAPAVMSMSVMLWMRTGQFERSSQMLKSLFQKNIIDYDLIYAAYVTGARTHDWPLMIQALRLRIQHWPTEAADGWLKLGDIYAQKAEVRDDLKALHAYHSAIEATPAANRNQTLEKIPLAYRSQLKVIP